MYYNDIPIGNFTCRLELEHQGGTSLYLMTMGILAVRTRFLPSTLLCRDAKITCFFCRHQAYRSRGVGSQVMETLLRSVTRSQTPKIDRIYLHVQVSNTAGKAFYEKHGFEEVDLQKDYYKKIQPRDAWILERVLTDSSAD